MNAFGALATILAATLAVSGTAQQSRMVKSKSNMAVASSAVMSRIKHATGVNAADRKFLNEIAIANRAEILLGKLAQQKGGSWARNYGKDMEREHTLALEELKKVAGEIGVSIPADVDAKHKAVYEKLSALSGSEFDRAYRQTMLKGHAEVLKKVQAEVRNGRNEKLRGYAVTMEPPVKMHLKMVQELTTMTGMDH